MFALVVLISVVLGWDDLIVKFLGMGCFDLLNAVFCVC